MKRTAVILLILIALTAPLAKAEGPVTSKWTWTGRRTGMTLTFTFDQEGSKLAGTVHASTGETVPISDGTINGGELSFTVNLGEELRFLCAGIMKGDEIELNAKGDGVGFSSSHSIVLQRVK